MTPIWLKAHLGETCSILIYVIRVKGLIIPQNLPFHHQANSGSANAENWYKVKSRFYYFKKYIYPDLGKIWVIGCMTFKFINFAKWEKLYNMKIVEVIPTKFSWIKRIYCLYFVNHDIETGISTCGFKSQA